jgi:hypothetical protein
MLKYLKFFDADPESRTEKIRIQDLGWKKFGSGINIPDPQHCGLGYNIMPKKRSTVPKVSLPPWWRHNCSFRPTLEYLHLLSLALGKDAHIDYHFLTVLLIPIGSWYTRHCRDSG